MMPLAAAQARTLSVFPGWSLCPGVKEGFCFHYKTYLYFSLKGFSSGSSLVASSLSCIWSYLASNFSSALPGGQKSSPKGETGVKTAPRTKVC